MASPKQVSLLDRIRRKPLPNPMPPIDAAIDISSVTESLFTDPGMEILGLEDMPNLAPPFKTFWMETCGPSRVISKATGTNEDVSDSMAKLRWGLFCESKRLPGDGFAVKAQLLFENPTTGQIGYAPDQIGIVYVTDKNGRSDGKFFILADKNQPDAEGKNNNKYWWYYAPGAFAISLMHCKNVSLAASPRNEKLSKAGERRGHPPLVRFHTLEIEPMRQTLRKEGNLETSGIKMALHQCRGHFKDYRQSGLFGKHKEVFWWDQAVRGSPEIGAVVTDYKINATQEKQP